MHSQGYATLYSVVLMSLHIDQNIGLIDKVMLRVTMARNRTENYLSTYEIQLLCIIYAPANIKYIELYWMKMAKNEAVKTWSGENDVK